MTSFQNLTLLQAFVFNDSIFTFFTSHQSTLFRVRWGKRLRHSLPTFSKMNPKFLSLAATLLTANRFFSTVEAADTILSVHGSGSSNPSKCFGSIMEDLQARSMVPVRLTYRGVGSSIGLQEFINEHNPTRSKLDFGIGEIPVPSEDWKTFRDNNVTILHLPTLFGAVSFFHSVPNTPNLNLTSCLLARIFTREITDWVHPDIREINPELSKIFDTANSLGSSLRIRVARRESGASSTKAITEVSVSLARKWFPLREAHSLTCTRLLLFSLANSSIYAVLAPATFPPTW